MTKYAGFFVTIDGPSGIGKSTVADLQSAAEVAAALLPVVLSHLKWRRAQTAPATAARTNES